MDDLNRALILVDIQRDFMPDGSLPVPDGDAVVPVANALQPYFDTVVATKDWHPPRHVSFASSHEGKKPFDVIQLEGGMEQVLWPDHCVQNSAGADFADGLDVSRVQKVFEKGIDPHIDSYSGFFDNGHQRATGLGEWLKERGITSVYLVGVAADVCVKLTALDARHLGLDTWVVEDATRGIDAQPGDVKRAFDAMKRAGVRLCRSDDLLRGEPAERQAHA